MNLTIQTQKLPSGMWKATAEEIPELFYFGASESEVVDRMARLQRALKSPNIRIDHVEPSGEVVLTLAREDDEDDETEEVEYRHGRTLSQAAMLAGALLQ